MLSFLRRHARTAIATGVVAVVGTGAGIGIASAAGSSSSTPSAAPAATTTAPPATSYPSPAAAPAGKHHSTAGRKSKTPRVRGTITAITPTSWTLRTTTGTTVTVDITSSTAYGSTKAPASASSFATGEAVVAVGARQGTTFTATRIEVPRTPASGAAPTSPASGAAS